MMKITAKQLQYLLGVLHDSLEIRGSTFGLSLEGRQALFRDILNQQSDELKEMENDERAN